MSVLSFDFFNATFFCSAKNFQIFKCVYVSNYLRRSESHINSNIHPFFSLYSMSECVKCFQLWRKPNQILFWFSTHIKLFSHINGLNGERWKFSLLYVLRTYSWHWCVCVCVCENRMGKSINFINNLITCIVWRIWARKPWGAFSCNINYVGHCLCAFWDKYLPTISIYTLSTTPNTKTKSNYSNRI